MNEEMDIRQILNILPHRYPFLLVDRVEKIKVKDKSEGSYIEGIKNVTFNEPFFQGHFPGIPVLPGVLLVEALAQLGALLVFCFTNATKNSHKVFLTGLDNVRFRSPVGPGDTLQMKTTVKKERNKLIWVLHGEAKVSGKLVCEADIMASMFPRKKEKSSCECSSNCGH